MKLERTSENVCCVRDDDGVLFAMLIKAYPTKWKIYGEDTYAKTPQELFKRLEARERNLSR